MGVSSPEKNDGMKTFGTKTMMEAEEVRDDTTTPKEE